MKSYESVLVVCHFSVILLSPSVEISENWLDCYLELMIFESNYLSELIFGYFAVITNEVTSSFVKIIAFSFESCWFIRRCFCLWWWWLNWCVSFDFQIDFFNHKFRLKLSFKVLIFDGSVCLLIIVTFWGFRWILNGHFLRFCVLENTLVELR